MTCTKGRVCAAPFHHSLQFVAFPSHTLPDLQTNLLQRQQDMQLQWNKPVCTGPVNQ
jgi:hypothetical protein